MTSRSELLTRTSRWLRRSGDVDFDADLPTMLRSVESRLAREVRHSSQEVVGTLSLTGRSTTLPSNCLELRSISTQGSHRQLELVTAEVLREGNLWNSGGSPCYYAIHNREVFVAPVASSTAPITLDITYWARLPALIADTDTNALLTDNFDLYLYALLSEAAVYLQDDRAQIGYEAKYSDARRNLTQADDDFRHSGSVPRRIGSGFVV